MFDFRTLEAMATLRRDDIVVIPTVSESEIDKNANVVSIDSPVVDIGQGAEDRYDKLFKSVSLLMPQEIEKLFLLMMLDRSLNFIPNFGDIYSIETQSMKAVIKAICRRLSEKLDELFPE